MSVPCQGSQDRIAFHNQFHADVIALFRKQLVDGHGR